MFSGLDDSHFSKWPTESIDFNISACCPLGMIEFLVSKRASLGLMNAKEVVATSTRDVQKGCALGVTHL